MMNHKLITAAIAAFIMFSISAAAFSMNPGNTDVDKLFREANLWKLISSKKALNLIAQTKDPKGATTHINELNDFVALGDVPLIERDIFTEFDEDQKILKKNIFEGPWCGPQPFYQNEIPNVSLQQGYELAQQCISASAPIGHVVVYKSLSAGPDEIIYDYAFKFPYLNNNNCQEVLYAPVSGKCSWGRIVSCHIKIKDTMEITQTGTK